MVVILAIEQVSQDPIFFFFRYSLFFFPSPLLLLLFLTLKQSFYCSRILYFSFAFGQLLLAFPSMFFLVFWVLLLSHRRYGYLYLPFIMSGCSSKQ